jgi:hypothetical protein
MVTIEAISLEEALRNQTNKRPSARTLRTRQLEADAQAVLEAIDKTGACIVGVTADEDTTAHYLVGLRSALSRSGHSDILLQKRRGRDEIVARMALPEDASRIAARRATSARLGQSAKARAIAARPPQKGQTRVRAARQRASA